MEKTNDVIGLGNTLMDFLVEVDEQKLIEFNLRKGEFHLVTQEEAKEMLRKIKSYELQVEVVPGGSVANTLRALGLLGSNVILCGKVGKDEHGEMYEEKIKNHGVKSRILNHHHTTGHALTFITPDSQRTFSVHLGAALELYKGDILEEDIAKSKVLHLEGYQLEGKTKETVLHALELAKKHGTKVSLDLSDGGVIRRNKELIARVLREYVDIVFANEVEAFDFTRLHEEHAARELGESCEIAIVKVGKEGSFIYTKNTTIKIRPFAAQAIDTTGAGDTFSAGFLHGYCKGWSLEKSGTLGSLLASRIVEKKGVAFSKEDFEMAQEKITTLVFV